MKADSSTALRMLLGLYVLSAPLAYMHDVQYALPGVPFSFLLHTVILALLLVFGLIHLNLSLAPGATMVMAFLLPALLSSMFMYVHLVMDVPFYPDPVVTFREYAARIANLAVNLSIFICFAAYAQQQGSDLGEKTLRWYYLLLLVAVAGGLWQFAGPLLGIPFPDLTVKSHFHGVDEEIKRTFGTRLTSFFAEPSYFVAFTIDFLVLSFLVLRRRLLLGLALSAGVFVLVMSYSMSGLANVILLMAAATAVSLYPNNLHKRKGAVRASLLIGLLIAAIVVLASGIDTLAPYYDRFMNRISLGNDHRLDVVQNALATWWQSGATVHLFGYGPGTFALFKYQREPMDGTSNSLYVDILLEHGLIGLIAVIALFAYFLVKGLNQLQFGRRQFVGTVLLVHLALSSLYRADFVSPRFWVLLLIIGYLLRKPEEKVTRIDYADGRSMHPKTAS